MPWQMIVTQRASRQLAALSRRDREAVERALRRLVADPSGANLKKLSGRDGEWRLRVGRWRVLLELDNNSGVIHVLRVLPRDIAYRD